MECEHCGSFDECEKSIIGYRAYNFDEVAVGGVFKTEDEAFEYFYPNGKKYDGRLEFYPVCE